MTECPPLAERHDGQRLDFRFTAPATMWESIAAGRASPIAAGLRGEIKVRGDMRLNEDDHDRPLLGCGPSGMDEPPSIWEPPTVRVVLRA